MAITLRMRTTISPRQFSPYWCSSAWHMYCRGCHLWLYHWGRMARAWAFKGWGEGGETTKSRQQNCIDIVLKWVTSENKTKYFLRVAQTAARHCKEGVKRGQASFPLWSQQSIWINFVADWRIKITARQPKTSLHPKKTRPISELKHTFRTTLRYGQCLTHAHIYITRIVKENAYSLTQWWKARDSERTGRKIGIDSGGFN